ncbi:MotA/TolQ/ExbB proton channel family protein [Rhodoferax sp.]|uniref:MotA/TolQ/ExbB proton channel family protein n=1 Tax=Rhodoferax sp. TaxID=50421 RepID=UPI00274F7353|nr:MotA/TolQ/ExbB proton channel family protein [Rhodoferax sp.]
MLFNTNQIVRSLAGPVLLALFSLTAIPALAQATAPATVAAPADATAATPAAVAPAAAVAPDAKKSETTENPYGVESVWKSSDAVAKSVLLMLVIMSVASWYILVVKLLEQTKIGRQSRSAAKDFWSAGTVQQGCAKLEATSPFRFIAEAGLEATQKHDGLMGHVPLNDWVTMNIQRSVERVQSSMQSGLSVLATVGSIAPFVGLFGTVWGIYHALTAIGRSGQASIDKVAGPVGEALIMTAIGLAVAVPAVLAYNWLIGRNKNVMSDVRAFGGDLHAVILGSVKKA